MLLISDFLFFLIFSTPNNLGNPNLFLTVKHKHPSFVKTLFTSFRNLICPFSVLVLILNDSHNSNFSLEIIRSK